MSQPYRAPRGSFEVLASLYGDVLGVERVGLDDGFFELGGDEHTLPRLVDAIYQRFGIAVTEATVRASPTVERLGRRMEHRRARGSPLVVPLSSGGPADASPFFCVVGGGGPATQFHAFAAAMASRPVYGIQQRGLEERALPDRTVGAYARRALREVRAIQPQGPYFIGGHSYGALVAFEMASQLVEAGAEVGLLVIIDVPVPPWASATQVRSRNQTSRQFAHETVLRMKRAYRRARMTTLGLVPRRGLEQYDAFYVLGLNIGRKYDRPGQCAAPTLVVRAETVEYFPDPTKALPDLGWAPRLSGPLTCVDAPGNHLTMIRPPYAATVVGLIEAAVGPGR